MTPNVELEPDTDRLDLGHTYVGDTVLKKLVLRNISSVAVSYRVKLAGQGNRRGDDEIFSKCWAY